MLEQDDGFWVAEDLEMGVASQGSSRQEALDNLDEAVEVTKEAQSADTPAPEPDAPWFHST